MGFEMLMPEETIEYIDEVLDETNNSRFFSPQKGLVEIIGDRYEVVIHLGYDNARMDVWDLEDGKIKESRVYKTLGGLIRGLRARKNLIQLERNQYTGK